jgi:hypothetical protein
MILSDSLMLPCCSYAPFPYEMAHLGRFGPPVPQCAVTGPLHAVAASTGGYFPI